MVRIEKDYVFDGPGGKVRLLDLFEGRRQLIIYHFMFAPGVDGWPTAGCPGCSMVVDHIGPLEHLYARDTSLVLVSLGPLANLEAYKKRMGWKVPWYSSAGTSFNADFGLSTDEGETFGLSASCATATRSITPTSPRIAGSRRWIRISPCSTGRRSDGRKPGKTPRPAGRNRSPTSGGAATMSIEEAIVANS